MPKRRRVRLLSAMIVVAVFMTGWMALRPPLWYYKQSPGSRTLPARLVRSAVRYVSGLELPTKLENPQAMFGGGREPWVFVRFHTDEEGIRNVMNTFGKNADEIKSVNGEQLRGWSVFTRAPIAQKRLGVNLYDQEMVRSATVISHLGQYLEARYTVLIDTERSDVYVSATLD